MADIAVFKSLSSELQVESDGVDGGGRGMVGEEHAFKCVAESGTCG